MRTRTGGTKLLSIAAFSAIFILFAVSASAHRLNEYLQATIITLGKDRIHASMRLIPGVAVSSIVLSSIDANADGMLSETERRNYAERVMHDLSLSVDGQPVETQIISIAFPPIAEMREGLGEIQIEFAADLPVGGSHRRLIFQNHHQPSISVYLMNCLMPQDRGIQIIAQNRNRNQSVYQIDYSQAGAGSASASSRDVGFASIFRLGMSHIAGGTDHLLFLLALLLPAPLLARGYHWARFAGLSHSWLKILRIVTAFTLGHSITLALAGLGLVRVSTRPIEVLIAVSILVSAAHALRPLFPGREAAIAAFFGLIHGFAFAATIGELGLDRWQRVAGILAFNLGIETMQLVVVAAIMPSLLLLSRTRLYSPARIGGALFAAFAAAGWVIERLLNLHSMVDIVLNDVARQAVWIALALFLFSLVCWSTKPKVKDPVLDPAIN